MSGPIRRSRVSQSASITPRRTENDDADCSKAIATANHEVDCQHCVTLLYAAFHA